MKKMINTCNIEGYVYQSNIQTKVVKNTASANFGKEYLSGDLEIAVNEDATNVITVKFTYVTPTTSKGATNATYEALKKVMEDNKTWMSLGKELAQKIRINTSISLNDFYKDVNDETPISIMTLEGGFVTLIKEFSNGSPANKFDVDMLFTSMVYDEKKDKNTLKGAIFNFRNDLMPISLTIDVPEGVQYFENLEISPTNPVLTRVWGSINCMTVVEKKEIPSAWGAPEITTTTKKSKSWEITGTQSEPYAFGDEAVLTNEEVMKCMEARQIRLAENKKRTIEYLAQRNAPQTPAQPASQPAGGIPSNPNWSF